MHILEHVVHKIIHICILYIHVLHTFYVDFLKYFFCIIINKFLYQILPHEL